MAAERGSAVQPDRRNGPRRDYSWAGLLRHGLRRRPGWRPAWRDPAPKARYRVVIVGAGGHGLATAYYLARNHGITDVAVLEKGWLGGGNTGRNTTVVRSNYLYPESARLYDLALRLYEGLGRELNFNIMLSQRGMIMTGHSRHDMDAYAHACNAMLLNGVDSELLDRDRVRAMAPLLNFGPDARYPIHGGILQRRAGIARHDAVAWGYARAADAHGIDIVQNCAVTGFDIEGGRVAAVQTGRGRIAADTVALCVAGHSSQLAGLAGFRLPIESYALQAMVSEPVKPVLDTVVLVPPTGMYLSQSDKGELVIGGGLDLYNSYGQRGNPPVRDAVLGAVVEAWPAFGRLKLMRQWGGIVDVVADSSPILGPAPVDGMVLNCGWGTGGFKAIPAGGWLTAHQIATGQPHPVAAPFGLHRFASGALIDEAAAAGIAH
ncbi:MAG: sarcosine oxidase subunit beta family protein [Sneathiellaceae bacterium]